MIGEDIMTPENQKEILDIYVRYHTKLKSMIITLETDDGEYPVEILNEIRAMMNHLAKCYIADDKRPSDHEKIIDKNIRNAKGHLRRAIFDCYKYGCISVEDFYQDFHFQTRHVDLGYIDNGEFSIAISNEYSIAKKALVKARKAEQDALDSSIPDDVYRKYEMAYELYDVLRHHIQTSIKKIDRAKHKQATSWWVAIGFGVFGVLGFLLSALGLLCFN